MKLFYAKILKTVTRTLRDLGVQGYVIAQDSERN